MSHLKSLFSILIASVDRMVLLFRGKRKVNLFNPRFWGLSVVAFLTACGGGGGGGSSGGDPLGSVRLSLPSGQTTTEAGGTLEVDVSLTIAPTATVTLKLTSSDMGEGTVAPATLIFTPDTWETPHPVTITGADDLEDDGHVVYAIRGTLTSSDRRFNNVIINGPDVTNRDDDPTFVSEAPVIFSPSSRLITTEAGGTATFDVSLKEQPTDTMTLTLELPDTREATLSAPTLTFTPSNWNTAQTVTVTGVDDTHNDGHVTYTLRATLKSVDPRFDTLVFDGPEVINRDDEAASGCDIRLNPALVGTVGTTGPCAGLLIVDDTMIRAAASSHWIVGGDDSFNFKPEDSYTTHTTGTYDFTQIYTGNVTDMNRLFDGSSFNQDIGHWDVSKVTDMYDMFSGNGVFNQDIGDWDVSSVTTMAQMFDSARAFNQNIGGWDVSKVTDMGFMFWGAQVFNQDLSGWNVCRVENHNHFATQAGDFEQNTDLHPDFGMACPVSTTSNAARALSTPPIQDLPAEPSLNAAAIDQSLAAGMVTSLLTEQAQTSLISSEAASRSSLVDWYSLGFNQSESSNVLSGTGDFVHATIGNNLNGRQGSALGFAFGVEQGEWDYSGQTDVTKTGLSAGLYGGRALGTLTLTGSAMLTLFNNDYVNEQDQTASSDSSRLMVSGRVSRPHQFARGASLTTYAELMYAHEDMDGYSYDDTARHRGTTADVGEVSLGAQYTTAVREGIGSFSIRGEVGSTFGMDALRVSDVTYTPHDGVSGEISFGWQSDGLGDVSGSADVTIGKIGDSDREELRLNNTWERVF